MTDQDIERIVRLVVEEWQRQSAEGFRLGSSDGIASGRPEGPRVLVLYAADEAALEEVFAPLRDLRKRGYALTHCVSPEARELLPPARIRAGMEEPPARVLLAEQTTCRRTLLHSHQALVIASWSRVEAVKVALTVTDTWASQLIFQALLSARPVVAMRPRVEPLPEPGSEGKAGHRVPPALQGVLEGYGRTLESFGVQWVEARLLAEATVRLFQADGSVGSNKTQRRDLVTAQDIEAAEGDLVVSAQAIITPLALDRARERGVTIRRLDQ